MHFFATPFIHQTSDVKYPLGYVLIILVAQMVKESACNVTDQGSIPVLGRSPGGGNGKPIQYSCLGNPMDRGAWWTTVHAVTKNQTCLRS